MIYPRLQFFIVLRGFSVAKNLVRLTGRLIYRVLRKFGAMPFRWSFYCWNRLTFRLKWTGESAVDNGDQNADCMWVRSQNVLIVDCQILVRQSGIVNACCTFQSS